MSKENNDEMFYGVVVNISAKLNKKNDCVYSVEIQNNSEEKVLIKVEEIRFQAVLELSSILGEQVSVIYGKDDLILRAIDLGVTQN